MMEDDYTPSRLANLRRVAIWGASRSGRDCLAQLSEQGIEVPFFIDKQPPENGKAGGVTVYAVRQIGAEPALLSDVDGIVLAMGADTSQPRARLTEFGFEKPVISFREGASIDAIFKGQLCVNKLFAYNGDEDDRKCISALAGEIKANGPLLIYGAGRLTKYLLHHFPELKDYVVAIADDDPNKQHQPLVEFPVDSVASVFIASTRYLSIEKLSRKAWRHFGETIKLIRVEDLGQLMRPDELPARAWRSPEYSIYPIEIPPIEFEDNLDFVLLDLPARFLGMMPNGLGYVHNILKSTGIRFQTMDLDMIFYHRYHSQRILDGYKEVRTPEGYVMRREPWTLDLVEEEWEKEEVIGYFQPDIDELVDELIRARPKMLGVSLHTTNLPIAKQVVARLREALPEIIIIVGGYDCIRPEQGPLSFPDFDYMVIFEAESTLADLIRRLMAGERPRNLPGIISRHGESSFPFVPAPLVDDLDSIDFPRYDWTNINLYQNYHGYRLTPIVLSRGCRWSRCTFCAERFPWRRRSPENMVDEIEWLAQQGCNLFHFNDSDLSGDPLAVRGVCEEIIRRGLDHLSFVGQLRVQKGYTQDYFHVLKQAGFANLRYGIDGWSKNTLKLHKKGYTLQMIEEVIGYTHSAGIDVSINLVIGIPGETDDDIDETIDNILKFHGVYNCIENINTLMLFAGSVYWEQPERHGIHFIGDKEELYRKYPRMIPSQYWYSEAPYIDQDVRKVRLQRIIDAANDAGIPIGNYAVQTIKKLGASNQA